MRRRNGRPAIGPAAPGPRPEADVSLSSGRRRSRPGRKRGRGGPRRADTPPGHPAPAWGSGRCAKALRGGGGSPGVPGPRLGQVRGSPSHLHRCGGPPWPPSAPGRRGGSPGVLPPPVSFWTRHNTGGGTPPTCPRRRALRMPCGAIKSILRILVPTVYLRLFLMKSDTWNLTDTVFLLSSPLECSF